MARQTPNPKDLVKTQAEVVPPPETRAAAGPPPETFAEVRALADRVGGLQKLRDLVDRMIRSAH